MDKEKLWNSFLEKIKPELNHVSYETWFAESKLYSLDEEKAQVLVPYPVVKKTIVQNYYNFVVDTFTEITGTNFKFEFVTPEELETNISINTDEIGVPPSLIFESNLKAKYTFDNFIVGESNRLAKVTAFAVAEHPGTMYNPLFIYSSSGLGKTHLMHAIGNYIVQNSKNKVLYVTCEQFVDDFIGISRKKIKTIILILSNFLKKSTVILMY